MANDIQGLSKADHIHFYVNHAGHMLNKKALFADGTDFYRQYVKKDKGYAVKLRFRTQRNDVDKVCIKTDTIVREMQLYSQDALFDYYQTILSYPECGTIYHFEIMSGDNKAVYNKRGAMDEVQEYYDFHFCPEFKTPDWAKGAVFYQLYVDRFYNGDPANDVLDHEYNYIHMHSEQEKNWMAYPKKMDVCHFYGGDLQGVMDKLDYLQELGVEVIYLNPIFVSPSNHKYDIQDYDYIDPHYGVILYDEGNVLYPGDEDNRHAERYMSRVTDKRNLEASNAFFIKFVEELHRRGMRVVLDGVFNHCGSFNKWLDRECIYENKDGYEPGAYVDENSPYHTFFKFCSQNWPYNKDYDGWWGHDTLPKLNYEESDKLYQYILEIGRKWVSPPYNVDGWRLDVAADLGHSLEFNHQFWRDFRKAVKEANPEALILAENYTDPASWLEGDQWDTVMNYEAFMEPITWFLTGMEKHSDEFREDLLDNSESFTGAMSHHMSRFHHESLYVAMNELSNHDHSRFLTRTGKQVGRLVFKSSESASEGIDKAIMREAVIMQMTWPGAPTVYYGDEAGVCGWTDPDNRRTYPWGNEDRELLAFHKEAIRIHKSSNALCTGSHKMLLAETGLLSYGRFDQKDRYVVVVNNRNDEAEILIPVWQIGVTDQKKMQQLLLSDSDTYYVHKVFYSVENGCMHLKMPRKSAIILKER